eukprot:1149801-Pelagomonas_calceolata.AAC.1
MATRHDVGGWGSMCERETHEKLQHKISRSPSLLASTSAPGTVVVHFIPVQIFCVVGIMARNTCFCQGFRKECTVRHWLNQNLRKGIDSKNCKSPSPENETTKLWLVYLQQVCGHDVAVSHRLLERKKPT